MLRIALELIVRMIAAIVTVGWVRRAEAAQIVQLQISSRLAPASGTVAAQTRLCSIRSIGLLAGLNQVFWGHSG